jgi:hypothetical protein
LKNSKNKASRLSNKTIAKVLYPQPISSLERMRNLSPHRATKPPPVDVVAVPVRTWTPPRNASKNMQALQRANAIASPSVEAVELWS